MQNERRYNEKEIQAIFKQAAADQEATYGHLSDRDGLTLAEIEQIGLETGIRPEFIARAAGKLDQIAIAPAPETVVGIPVSVGRVVDLPGDFTDRDWDRLVADLHDAFDVTGKVERNGSLRQWKSAHVSALVEPIESGHRLRLRLTNEGDRAILYGGIISFCMGLVFLMALAGKGDFLVDMGKTIFLSMFSVFGMGAMGVAAWRLPRWRAQQEGRLEAIAYRALERASPNEDAVSESLRRIDLERQEASVDMEPMPQRRKTRL